MYCFILDSPLSTEADYRVEALVSIPNLVELDQEEYEPEETEEADEVNHFFLCYVFEDASTLVLSSVRVEVTAIILFHRYF